ncbi:MAG: hypothetical protein ABIK18_04230, partial [candidate division WOR-3 bacterium]
MSMRKRIGVFVCHCGINIAGVVKVPELVGEIKKIPGVISAMDYVYCCSDPGQNLIKRTIKSEGLEGIVV